jgi:hypothetical protein
LVICCFEGTHQNVRQPTPKRTCALLELLRHSERDGCAFVVIVGASGSGKSSLARAGVAANLLRHGSDNGVEQWRVTFFMPSLCAGDLFGELARTLAEAIPEVRDSQLA